MLNKLKNNWSIPTEDSDVPVDEYAEEYWHDFINLYMEDCYEADYYDYCQKQQKQQQKELEQWIEDSIPE